MFENSMKDENFIEFFMKNRQIKNKICQKNLMYGFVAVSNEQSDIIVYLIIVF